MKDYSAPAFPQPLLDRNGGTAVASDFDAGGMTLRDYFAAKAMQACWSNISTEFTARKAYQMADAMLIERVKA